MEFPGWEVTASNWTYYGEPGYMGLGGQSGPGKQGVIKVYIYGIRNSPPMPPVGTKTPYIYFFIDDQTENCPGGSGGAGE